MTSRLAVSKLFLRRRTAALPFVGTIVLLATFLVNDALRNESKNLADSVSLAETSFSARKEIEGIAGQLNKQEDTLAEIQGLLSKSNRIDPNKSRPLWDISREIDEKYPSYLSHVSTFDNTVDLLDKLPYDHQLDEQRWTLKMRLNHLDRLLLELRKRRYYLYYGYLGEADQVLPEIAASRATEDAEVGADKLNTSAEVDAFAETVFNRARLVQDKADKRSTLWKRLSYLLYPFGVILGLIGRLYGQASPENE